VSAPQAFCISLFDTGCGSLGNRKSVIANAEIEQAVEQFPLPDFVKLAVWFDQRRQQLEIFPSSDKSRGIVRDHSAFLNSYAPQEEGLHDDAPAG
jgi:hypothetical protein